MNHALRLLLAGVLFALFPRAAAARDAPTALPVETLAGAALRIPEGLSQAANLLIVGFTKPSRAQTAAWSRAMAAAEGGTGIAVYQVAMLEDVPAWLRGVVLRGIRSDVPQALHERFLVVTAQTEAWRRLLAYSKPDDAYLVLFGADRAVQWRYHGAPTPEAQAALQGALPEPPR